MTRTRLCVERLAADAHPIALAAVAVFAGTRPRHVIRFEHLRIQRGAGTLKGAVDGDGGSASILLASLGDVDVVVLHVHVGCERERLVPRHIQIRRKRRKGCT